MKGLPRVFSNAVLAKPPKAAKPCVASSTSLGVRLVKHNKVALLEPALCEPAPIELVKIESLRGQWLDHLRQRKGAEMRLARERFLGN